MTCSPVLAVCLSSELHTQGEVSPASPVSGAPASPRLGVHRRLGSRPEGELACLPAPVRRPPPPPETGHRPGSLGTRCSPRLESEPACLPSTYALRPLTPGLPEDACSPRLEGGSGGLRAGGLHAAHRGPLTFSCGSAGRDLERPGSQLLLASLSEVSFFWAVVGHNAAGGSGILSSPAAQSSSSEAVRPPHRSEDSRTDEFKWKKLKAEGLDEDGEEEVVGPQPSAVPLSPSPSGQGQQSPA